MSRSKKYILAHLALLFVTLCYSGNFIIAQDIMRGDFISPIALVFFRVAGAGVLFWIVHFFLIKESIQRKDLGYLFLCAIVGVVLSMNTFLFGLEKTPTINASLIISTTPIIVTVFSFLILKERINIHKSIGLLLGLSGTIILILSKDRFQLGNNYVVGNLLIFSNAISFGLYLVMLKPMLNKYHSITVVKWVFTLGAPFIFLISFSEVRKIEWSSFSNYAWIGLIYVIVFATFCTYALNAWAIKILTPVIAGLFLYLQPFLTTILSISFGKDVLTFIKIVAGILILTGLYFVIFKKEKV